MKDQLLLIQKYKIKKSKIEVYIAQNNEIAKNFLLTKKIKSKNHFVIVQTSTSNYSKDANGMFHFQLMPFRIKEENAEILGQIIGLPAPEDVKILINKLTRSLSLILECGKCHNQWRGSINFLLKTVLECPVCGSLNAFYGESIKISIVNDEIVIYKDL